MSQPSMGRGPTHGRANERGGGLLSVVVPCHDEEAVIADTHRRLTATLPATGMDYEVVYVDDGSRDGTLAALERIAASDPRAVVVELSRNFGQQAAMSAGLAHTRGEAVVLIDADLQDPPEVIPEMVERWREGVDVAYGRRRSREGETWFKLVTASLFHRLLASLVPHPIPVDTGDFRLLDRSVVESVLALPERRRYMRSLVAWTGFRQEPVWYDRHSRPAGRTKYSFRKLAALAVDALILSSDAPMRLSWLAAACMALTAGVFLLAAALCGWSTLPSVGAIVTAAASLQIATVSVVGEYVVRTYREAQGRPTWLEKRVITSRPDAVRQARAA
jgi:glycosyltransferase involved in cell wall biosynthesis